MKLITHLHLVSRLRISGAIPLIPLYAFKMWTGEMLPFTCTIHVYQGHGPASCCNQFSCGERAPIIEWKERCMDPESAWIVVPEQDVASAKNKTSDLFSNPVTTAYDILGRPSESVLL
jgi:hypothetical protein